MIQAYMKISRFSGYGLHPGIQVNIHSGVLLKLFHQQMNIGLF